MQKLFLFVIILSISISFNCKNQQADKEKLIEEINISKTAIIPEEYKNKTVEELNKIGLSFHKKKDYMNSQKLFKYAIAKDNSFIKGYFNITCSYSLDNKKEDAIEALKKAMEIDKKYVLKYLNDSDLDNIRSLPYFREIVKQNKKIKDYTSFIGKKLCIDISDWGKDPELVLTLKRNNIIISSYSTAGASIAYKFKSGKWSVADNILRITITWQTTQNAHGMKGSPHGSPLGDSNFNLKYNSPEELNNALCK
ncbi:hypothetical protein ACFL20_02295 [Spirochaetota bacterium]